VQTKVTDLSNKRRSPRIQYCNSAAWIQWEAPENSIPQEDEDGDGDASLCDDERDEGPRTRTASYSYVAQNQDELSFTQGDEVSALLFHLHTASGNAMKYGETRDQRMSEH
jgi:hypothetical protein